MVVMMNDVMNIVFTFVVLFISCYVIYSGIKKFKENIQRKKIEEHNMNERLKNLKQKAEWTREYHRNELATQMFYLILQASGLDTFVITRHRLHKIMYYLRFNRDLHCKDVLDMFRFKGSPAAPFSDELEEAISTLHFEGLLYVNGNNPEKFIIGKQYTSRNFSFTGQQYSREIELLGAKFKELMNQENIQYKNIIT